MEPQQAEEVVTADVRRWRRIAYATVIALGLALVGAIGWTALPPRGGIDDTVTIAGVEVRIERFTCGETQRTGDDGTVAKAQGQWCFLTLEANNPSDFNQSLSGDDVRLLASDGRVYAPDWRVDWHTFGHPTSIFIEVPAGGRATMTEVFDIPADATATELTVGVSGAARESGEFDLG